MPFVTVSVVALLFGFVGSLPMAGPIAILVVSKAVDGHEKDARGIGYGAAVGEGIYAFLAFWGFATFLARHAIVLPISHGVTGAIMLVLGVHFLRFKAAPEASAKREKERSGNPFWVGLSIAAVNPTLLASWSAVTTFLYSRQLVRMTSLLAIPFGAFAALGIALWAVSIVALLHRFRDHFPRKALTWVVRSMGLFLIAIAVWSFTELGIYLLNPRARTHALASALVTAADEREAC